MCECRHGIRYVSPFRPSATGLSSVAVRPFSPSAITSKPAPSAAASWFGQRTSRGNRAPAFAGSTPHVFESP